MSRRQNTFIMKTLLLSKHRWLLLVLALAAGIGVAIGVLSRGLAGDREAIPQFQVIGTIKFEDFGSLNDVTATRILITDFKSGHIVYDWDGKELWRVPLEDEYPRRPADTLWEFDRQRYFTPISWASPDRVAMGCAADRSNGAYATTCRLSPNGEYVGSLNRHPRGLQVTVWRQGKMRWQAFLRISPQGPITGKHRIGLLVGDDGSIVLYTPFPKPEPIAYLANGSLQLHAHLENTYTDFVSAYVRTLGGEPPKAPLIWQHQASAKDGSYLLAQSPYGRYRCIFTILYEEDESDTSVGRAKLSVEEYPGREVAQLQLPSRRSAEEVYIDIPIPHEQPIGFNGTGGGNYAYFCPRQRRLLLEVDRLCIMAY